MVSPDIRISSAAARRLDYEALFNAAPTPYLVLRADPPKFTIVAVTDAYLAATMTERDGILGRGLFEVFPDNPEDSNANGVQNLRASLMRVLESRGPHQMPIQKYDIRTPDGGFEERFWTPLNTPVLSESGEVAEIIHQVDDVSEKVQENRILMQLAMDHAAIGAWVFDPATGFSTSSEEVRRMFGAEPSDRGTDYLLSHVHSEDRARVEQQFRSAVQTGRTYEIEFRIKKNDEIRWLRSKIRMLDARVGPARVIGFVEDITERKLAERLFELSQAELQKQWAELETLYRTAPIGLALFDPVEFRYLRLNNRQAEIVGLPPDQILGKTLTEIAPIEGLQEMFEGVARGVPLHNALLEGELPMRPGEHRYWTVNYEPVFGVDGRIQAITAASLEITAQKRAEKALVESEKLAAVGRLAASIAHEINNPLESITNLIYLARHASSVDRVRKYLEIADTELARVSQIATQTLRFHRQSSRPVPARIYEILDNVLALYQGRISNAGVQIVKQYRESPPIACFADEIRQVLANLISNAVDATPSGGAIVLRKRERTNWRTGQRGVRVTIADSGHGMNAETRKRIFEAFFTTKGTTGTGLGLWVSHGIVEKHGGTVRVRSKETEPHRGTLFSLFLPFDNPTVKPG